MGHIQTNTRKCGPSIIITVSQPLTAADSQNVNSAHLLSKPSETARTQPSAFDGCLCSHQLLLRATRGRQLQRYPPLISAQTADNAYSHSSGPSDSPIASVSSWLDSRKRQLEAMVRDPPEGTESCCRAASVQHPCWNINTLPIYAETFYLQTYRACVQFSMCWHEISTVLCL